MQLFVFSKYLLSSRPNISNVGSFPLAHQSYTTGGEGPLSKKNTFFVQSFMVFPLFQVSATE